MTTKELIEEIDRYVGDNPKLLKEGMRSWTTSLSEGIVSLLGIRENSLVFVLEEYDYSDNFVTLGFIRHCAVFFPDDTEVLVVVESDNDYDDEDVYYSSGCNEMCGWLSISTF